MSGMSAQGVIIRPFESGDEEAFRLLNEEWITRYFHLEERDKKILGGPQAILDSGGRILFAVLHGEAVGCCALVPMGDGSFELSKMAVMRSRQGEGIGRLLLKEAIAEARRLGAYRLYLETNSTLVPAIRLYESLGFQHIPADQITPSPYQRADVYMELLLH
jgi:GNAT superfamily N-acetyltransferase